MLDVVAAAAVAKSSSSTSFKTNGKLNLLSADKNGFRGGNKNVNAAGSKSSANGEHGGDIIPIPDHLLKMDYDEHHDYSYEEGQSHEYDDYDDDYHHLEKGKNAFNV